jgi:hypothetical protein
MLLLGTAVAINVTHVCQRPGRKMRSPTNLTVVEVCDMDWHTMVLSSDEKVLGFNYASQTPWPEGTDYPEDIASNVFYINTTSRGIYRCKAYDINIYLKPFEWSELPGDYFGPCEVESLDQPPLGDGPQKNEASEPRVKTQEQPDPAPPRNPKVDCVSGFWDVCGKCDGDNTTCLDCKGIPNGTKTKDVCGVCGGDGKSCLDCEGTVNGRKATNRCGQCAEDDSSCIDEGQDGRFVTVGCDNKVGSVKRYNRCHMCGSDDSECDPCMTGHFWKCFEAMSKLRIEKTEVSNVSLIVCVISVALIKVFSAYHLMTKLNKKSSFSDMMNVAIRVFFMVVLWGCVIMAEQDIKFPTILRCLVYLVIGFPLEQFIVKKTESYVEKLETRYSDRTKKSEEISVMIHTHRVLIFTYAAPAITIVLLGFAILSVLTNVQTEKTHLLQFLLLSCICICAFIILHWSLRTHSKAEFLNVCLEISMFDNACYGDRKISISLLSVVGVFDFLVFAAAMNFLHTDIRSYACLVAYIVFAVKLWMRFILRFQHATPYFESNHILNALSIISVACMSFPQHTEMTIISVFLDMLLYIPGMWYPNFHRVCTLCDVAYFGTGHQNSNDTNRVVHGRLPYNALLFCDVNLTSVSIVGNNDEFMQNKSSDNGRPANVVILIFKGVSFEGKKKITHPWEKKALCLKEITDKFKASSISYEIKIESGDKTFPMEIYTAYIKKNTSVYTALFFIFFAVFVFCEIYYGAHYNTCKAVLGLYKASRGEL